MLAGMRGAAAAAPHDGALYERGSGMDKVIGETDGKVRTIWMNRPEKRNALDSDMRRVMTDALRAPVAAEDRVVVIRGKGGGFCSGLDMAERRQTMGSGEASGIEALLRAIELCPLP